MKKIIASLAMITLVGTLAVGATRAYFSDTETSAGNTLSAGTLDLNVDDGNTNVVKFTVDKMRPGNQPKRKYTLANVGTINGYLDLENIAVTSYENVCIDPEMDAGDTTCGDPGMGKGELQDVVNLRLFVDYGCDGSISAGDNKFYDGLVNALPGNFELNEPINTGNKVCIGAIFDWWPTANDDLAQSDSMVFDMTFELAQTTGQ